jgi:hypothetical protein
MEIEFFYLKIEKYFFKDRSEEKKGQALKILGACPRIGKGKKLIVNCELLIINY